MGVPTIPENQLVAMERCLGRKLTTEERRLLSYTVHTQPIAFHRRNQKTPIGVTGAMQEIGKTTCPKCSGHGKLSDESECPFCQGTGLVPVVVDNDSPAA